MLRRLKRTNPLPGVFVHEISQVIFLLLTNCHAHRCHKQRHRDNLHKMPSCLNGRLHVILHHYRACIFIIRIFQKNARGFCMFSCKNDRIAHPANSPFCSRAKGRKCNPAVFLMQAMGPESFFKISAKKSKFPLDNAPILCYNSPCSREIASSRWGMV